MTPDERLEALGIVLPTPPVPVANFVTAVRHGDTLYLSGQGPTEDGRPVATGKLGGALGVEEGYRAARLCALNLLGVVRAEIGALDRVERIVKLLAFVASEPGFDQQPSVVNGASDLLVEVFGARGRHARSAIGTHQLPFDIPVEIEMIVALQKGA